MRYLAYTLLCLMAATVVSCKDDWKYPMPETIKMITGADANECPSPIVRLAVEPVNGADWYQWYKDGVAIDDATTPTYAAKESGVYTVEGVNAAGAGPRSEAKTVTISECPQVELNVDNLVGNWTVTEEQLSVGATWDTFTYTMSIEKVSDTRIKVRGFFGATDYPNNPQPLDSLVAMLTTINEDSLAITIPAQAVTPTLPPATANTRFIAINPYYKITGAGSYYYNPIMPLSYENVNFIGVFVRNEEGAISLEMKSSLFPDSDDFLSYAFVRTDADTGKMLNSLYNVYIFSRNCVWVKNP